MPMTGGHPGDVAAIGAAAARGGFAPWILWGIYGAESSFGTNDGYAGSFGLISQYHSGMSISQQAMIAASDLQNDLKVTNNNLENALRRYSGNSYGVSHIQQLARGGPFPITNPSDPSVGKGLTAIGKTTATGVDDVFKQYVSARDMQRTAPQSEFASFDPLAPFKWLGNQFQQSWGYIFGDAPKGQKSQSLLQQGTSIFGDVGNAINSALDFLKFIAWIFHPVNILRGVEFLTGMALMFYGAQAHYQAYREEARGGYRGSRSAVQRSGIGRTATRVAEATPAGRTVRAVRGRRAGARSARRQQYYREYDRSYRSSRRRQETRETNRQNRRRRKPQ